jgi:hypothetical protein
LNPPITFLTFLIVANPRPATREPRSPRPIRTELAEVEPLRQLCRRTNRPDHLDDRGRRLLAELPQTA